MTEGALRSGAKRTSPIAEAVARHLAAVEVLHLGTERGESIDLIER